MLYLWLTTLAPTLYFFRNIVEQIEYSNIGATEMILSNGMRVCYKCTDFFDDQVYIVLRPTDMTTLMYIYGSKPTNWLIKKLVS